MPLIESAHIGRKLSRLEREVEAGRLSFFLNVVGERGPVAADGRLQVPPTYLFCLEMLDDPTPVAWLEDIGVNFLHILHGTQRFDYHAPAFVGDRLVFERSIDDIYAKKGGALQFVVKRSRVSRADGVAIATLASTVVVRDPTLKGAAA